MFEYLSKYTFTAHGNQAFLAGEGKISKVDCRGFEKGGPTTPLEKRAAIECAVTEVQPEKPAGDAGAPAASGAASASGSVNVGAPPPPAPAPAPLPSATTPPPAPGK
ncbi:MAG TPA: hypothetical protein VFP84_30385 [Kofleriaceae bacterium]|nr:hypothetical protein [Kofleriaceae bacterium]